MPHHSLSLGQVPPHTASSRSISHETADAARTTGPEDAVSSSSPQCFQSLAIKAKASEHVCLLQDLTKPFDSTDDPPFSAYTPLDETLTPPPSPQAVENTSEVDLGEEHVRHELNSIPDTHFSLDASDALRAWAQQPQPYADDIRPSKRNAASTTMPNPALPFLRWLSTPAVEEPYHNIVDTGDSDPPCLAWLVEYPESRMVLTAATWGSGSDR